MRYAIFPINPHMNYGITIGSRDKPDSQLKEQIKGQIDSSMEYLGGNSRYDYKVAVIHDLEGAESGSAELPTLEPGNLYLIFALLYSDPNDSSSSLSKAELEEYQREIGEMIDGITNQTRTALVLLQDCTVSLIEANRFYQVTIGGFNYDRGRRQ